MSTLRIQLEARLQELHKELADGEKMIADLQARQNQIRETLLRISGAVQVLEEVLQEADEAEAAPASPLQEAPVIDPPPAPIAAAAAAIAPAPAPAPAAWP